MSCQVHVCFIAVNIRNNLQPHQPRWDDVYLTQTLPPLHTLPMRIKAIILSVCVSFLKPKFALPVTHLAELAGLSFHPAFLLETEGSADSE